MRVNVGGDAGQDDYGLPPVDIEVPDDARELDRDVQAYQRELRALRRRRRAKKLYGPLMRDGMVLPMLAGCLALTLLAGTLLTVFTAGPGTLSSPSTRRSARAGPSSPARPAAVLPDAIVVVDGRLEPLRDLIGPVLVLALIPPRCRCFHDVSQLIIEAANAGAQPYLVGTRGTPVQGWTRRLGMETAHALEDSVNGLPASYEPATLTAVVVRTDGSIADFVRDQGHGFQLTALIRSLLGGTQQPSPSSSASVPVATPGGKATPAGKAAPGG
jgi:hypothetical protein